MSAIIFIIILSALVIVHELGHFLVARFFGIRVDEFGLGLPPRAKQLFVWKNTPFTLNWLPFGGFVKIFGENPGEETQVTEDSFQSKNRSIQGLVLVAGVFGNFLFAWALITLGFVIGLPISSDFPVPIQDSHTVVSFVVPESPAALAGLKSGDTIISATRGGIESKLTPEEISSFISESTLPITFKIKRGEESMEKVIVPKEGIVEGRSAIGITMDSIGIAKLRLDKAIWHGLRVTSELTWLTAQAIVTFIVQAFGGRADLSGVTGPVGIVGMVGEVRALGFAYLLTFTAIISINLSIINLLPFPALDGGRLLFVAIEAVTRRRIPARVANTLNTVGFAFLIFLMLLITIRDVRNIF